MKPKFDRRRAQLHINRLASQHNIYIRIRFGSSSVYNWASDAAARTIYIGLIETSEDYLTALHEIGHIVLNHRRLSPLVDSETLAYEEAATEWSYENCKFKVSRAAVAHQSRSLAWYRENLGKILV